MPWFRKKPVEIEAVQFKERPDLALPEGVCVCMATPHGMEARPHIHTLEGVMLVSEGDWVITGIKGEKYPCKPDIFEASYDAATKLGMKLFTFDCVECYKQGVKEGVPKKSAAQFMLIGKSLCPACLPAQIEGVKTLIVEMTELQKLTKDASVESSALSKRMGAFLDSAGKPEERLS